MTIRHLRIFIAVCRNQGVTGAARSLHMTQPTVTRAVQELEDYYGISLFERIHRRLYITEAGKRLYDQAIHVVSTMDRMEASMEEWEKKGTIRIGAGTTLGSVVLPRVLTAFVKKYPDIQIYSYVSDRHVVLDRLMHNELDLALIEGAGLEKSLESETIGYDQMALLLAPEHPLLKKKHLKVEDLSGERIVVYGKESASRTFMENLYSLHGMPFEPVMESESILAVIEAVHAGIGLSMLPRNLVGQQISSGYVAAHAPESEKLLRKNYVVWHGSKYLSRTMKDLIGICRETGEALLTDPPGV